MIRRFSTASLGVFESDGSVGVVKEKDTYEHFSESDRPL